MIEVRRSAERGKTAIDWLDSRHSFSFGEYWDPAHMGFGPLRVINEDRVAPGGGFPTHGHRDMEILTWVLDGALAHRDSLGSGAVLHTGELQRMTAGTGIRHSEFNDLQDAPVHFLQIWIQPERTGLAPGYEQRAFDGDGICNRLRLVASRDGRSGSLSLARDTDVYAARLTAGASLTQPLAPGRRAWLQVARGRVRLEELALGDGDGAAITGESAVTLKAEVDLEVLLFDLTTV